jgi:hypothetical protein
MGSEELAATKPQRRIDADATNPELSFQREAMKTVTLPEPFEQKCDQNTDICV